MYTYKKFTSQDYAVIPFHAHKQYSFGSSSAASNIITYYDTRWTSESISLYSTASSVYGGDSKNTIRYNQIDHLFYKDFLTNHANLFGTFHYLKHKRNLYERTNILSIPAGLYGSEIKPGSFYLSSSNQEIIDDSYGNLIISGTNTANFPTDVRSNVFRLDPIKAFKKYDLGIFNDYALKITDPQHPEAGTKKAFWKKGKVNPNAPTTYTTSEDVQEIDDSYFLNSFKYRSVTFNTSSVGSSNHRFPAIRFNSLTGSRIVVDHEERFNFNTDDEFSVSFYMEPMSLSTGSIVNQISVGDYIQGGYVFNITDGIAYIVNPKERYMKGMWGPGTTHHNFTDTTVGQGETNTTTLSSVGSGYLGRFVDDMTIDGYTDWWFPNVTEINSIVTNLGNPYTNTNFSASGGPNNILDLSVDDAQATSKTFDLVGGTIVGLRSKTSNDHRHFLAVRKVDLSTLDNAKRYIISKSTTKSVIPSAFEGRSEILNTSVEGNMQPLDIASEQQFPFEIYMQSSSLYFDRSDGHRTLSINCEVTRSSDDALHPAHILCQKSASLMQIYFNGNLIVSGSDSLLTNPTRNRANLYIGSKGNESKNDYKDNNSSFKYFNGNLSCINIWEKTFNSTEVSNISESINSSPYIGNIFYQNGFATITHPKYHSILGDLGIGDMQVFDTGSVDDFIVDSEFYTGINKIEFQGTHLIHEHEYQCTVDEHEYNQTTNISARKKRSNNDAELANFTTSSIFNPYITTIGLYNEHNELLVIGKLNQPIKTSNKTDTTFIVRWDT